MASTSEDESQRPAAAGDTAAALDAVSVEQHEVAEAIGGSTGTLVNSVQDVLAHAGHGEQLEVARWLDAVLAGTSVDDLSQVRSVLLAQDEPMYGDPPMSSDDELVDGWRDGQYPYKNLMRRKTYEAQKYRLQAGTSERAPLRPAHDAVHRQGHRPHRTPRPAHRGPGQRSVRTRRVPVTGYVLIGPAGTGCSSVMISTELEVAARRSAA